MAIDITSQPNRKGVPAIGIVWIIGIVIASFIGYNWIYIPQQREIAKIQALVDNELGYQSSQASVVPLLAKAEAYRSLLAPAPDTSWLVKEIVSISEDIGIQLTDINPESLRELGIYTRIGVQIKFTASYHEVGLLLDRLELADHILQVDRVDMRPKKDIGGVSFVSMVISSLYLPPIMGT